ncbi:MAG: hypothetical protein PUK62_09285 [Prevotellaceae bacterium]|nr:hypothetical protein [Prevotellaceae bacterium]
MREVARGGKYIELFRTRSEKSLYTSGKNSVPVRNNIRKCSDYKSLFFIIVAV